MEPKNSSISSDREPSKTTAASSSHARPNRKSTASSAMVMKHNGKSAVSSAILKKPNASTALSSAHGDQVMFFRDVSLGPTEADLRNKAQYRVTDHSATVTFAWNFDLSVLDNPLVPIHEDRFRFHSYEEFQANCDRKVDLYDYVGHMKLVNGQTITEHMVLDEVDIAERRHLCVHVQTHDGPVMKLYLWDKAASDFCEKFKSYGSTPSVLLVTTVNPKHPGVFMDNDVQPSRDYLGWLSSNSDLANKINAEVVTTPETATLEELFAYIKHETAKVAWFECTATIDGVLRGSAWYYISCGGCNSKAVKGSTSLICNNKKCGKRDVTRCSVSISEHAVFVILGDAGKELTGKHASELVASYFEANEGVEADHCVPVPQALLDTIGHTYRFIVKVSDHNLSCKTQTITVTKIFPPAAPQTIAPLEGHAVPPTSDDILKTGGDRVRQASESLESAEAKRCKSG
uniref:Replication factor A C-terminal domain-containing protein n=1 Tax=Brassica oleracea var. oleracea TaxID=109376 RepID=A0A0D3DBK0_BRAOL